MAIRPETEAGDPRNLQYQALKSRVYEGLLNRLNLERLAQVDREEAEPELRSVIVELLEREAHTTPLSETERHALTSDLLSELFGVGPLEPLLADPTVSCILVNRADQVYVERDGRLEITPTAFRDDRHLLQIIDRIVSSAGRRIDESSPIVDTRLTDGSRVSAIIAPLALDGPALLIQRFRSDRLCSDDLLQRGALSRTMLDFLGAVVASRLNVLVSGDAGSGKTTLMNVLLTLVSDRERVVTIEEAAELKLPHHHVLRLETRPANIEGKGAVGLRQLVLAARRMRPDRIVVGEVRGDEALDMLQTWSMAHPGSMATVQAISPSDALDRLSVMVAAANSNLSERTIRQHVVAAVHLIIQTTRLADGVRRVTAVSEITGVEGDEIALQDVFVFESSGMSSDGKVSGRFRATGIRPRCCERLARSGILLPTDMFEQIQSVG